MVIELTLDWIYAFCSDEITFVIFLRQVCGGSDKEEYPPNFIKLPKDAYTPDVIAASDCMLGTLTETVLLC